MALAVSCYFILTFPTCFSGALNMRVCAPALTMPVCHAVKEHPILFLWSVFHKGDVVAGLDAEHSKQLHFFSRDPQAAQMVPLAELLGGVKLGQLVRFPLVMRVSLQTDTRENWVKRARPTSPPCFSAVRRKG